MLEGLQEIMQVISELLSKRDYVRNALATNEYGKAQKKVEANLNDLDVLKWKWISLLPNEFINECDNFRFIYKNWMVAQRNINSEGKEQVSKLSNSLDNSRTELTKMIREIAPTKYLYKSVTGIIDEDRDT